MYFPFSFYFLYKFLYADSVDPDQTPHMSSLKLMECNSKRCTYLSMFSVNVEDCLDLLTFTGNIVTVVSLYYLSTS